VRKRVFISYRREDTAAVAGRVYDRLCRVLSPPNVFFDVSTIGGGDDFPRRIAAAIEKSDAALIFIGKKWLDSTDARGVTRLSQTDDFVRTEVREALARPILVLPVLIDGAVMPAADSLPQDIKALTTKNALRLQHESFDDDTEKILATVLGIAKRDRLWDDKGRFAVKLAYAAGGVAVALALIVVVAFVHFWLFARPLEASIGAQTTNVLLIATTMLGAWLGVRYEARRRKVGVRA
jgi:hypothetical protein